MAIEKIFIDTSAFYALMDRSDSYHHSVSVVSLNDRYAAITNDGMIR